MKKSRRALILLFAFILAVTSLILPMSAAEYKTGDMNGDGRVNSDDAIYLLRHTLSPAQYPLACNHNLIQHEANAPTCTEKGYNAYETCSRCGQTTYEELEALGHNYENYKCSRCGETYTSDIPYSEGLEFKSNGNGTASVIGIGTCKDPVIVIPDMSPFGDMITAIDKEAFLGCISIKSVLIPDSVKSIGNRAFFGCYGLAEVINKSSLNIIKGSSNNGYVSYYALEVHSGESKIVNNDGYLFSTFSEDDNANTAKITNDGIIFINADGSAKTVVIGNGPKYQVDTHSSNKSATIGNSDTTLDGYSGKMFGTEIGDKFYLTYNVNASDFDGVKNGEVFSFISWKNSIRQEGTTTVSWWHLLRIHNDNGVYRIVLGTENYETRAVMELNKTYSFVFEFEYTHDDSSSGTYTKKVAAFRAYMDGKFIGDSSIAFEQSDRPNKTIRVNGGLGTVTYTDFKLFKPEKEILSDTARTTDDGIIFTNPDGTTRVVTIGTGAKYELNSREVSDPACLDGNAANTLNSYKGSIFGTEIGDKFFLTYNVNVSDFGSIADGATSSFTSWKTTSSGNDTTWGHLVRLKNDEGVYRVVIGESTQTDAVMELNKTYSFVFELTYVRNDSTAGKKTASVRTYMDGEFIGQSSIVFAQDSRPNNTIRLNGITGLKAAFTNIKLFKPEKDEIVDAAITTNEGIIFINADGSTETVAIGNGPILSNAGPLSLEGSKRLNAQLGINLEDYKGKIFLTGIGDKFYMSFNLSLTGISLAEGNPQSFISWMYGPNDYAHLIRLQKVNGEYKILLGNDNIPTSALINTDEEYSFIFAFEYIGDNTYGSYTSKIATCKVYIDGIYIGETLVTLERSDKEGGDIRLNTNQVGGTATYTDFKFYKPEKDELVSVGVVADYLFGYVGEDTELLLPQSYNGKKYQIADYAFYNCDALTKIWLPGTVTNIGDYSFYDCDGLTDVIVNGGEISIGKDAFGECDSFTNITYKVDAAIIVKEDTYVVNNDGDGDKSGYTFSTEPELNVKTNGESMTRYTYLKFDISSLAGDDNFTCIDLDLMQTRRESNTPEFCAVDVYACDPSINVDELTFNNQPTQKIYVTGNNKIDSENVIRSFSITDYVRFALSKGQSEIVLCLKDSTPAYPHRLRFASLESGKNAPKLSVYYGTKVDDQKFIDGGVFGDPQISENGLDAILGQHDIANMTIPVSEDAYTEAGESSDTNFGTSDILSFKGSSDVPTKYYRVVLLKFNIEEIPTDYKGSVNLALYCNYKEAEIPNVHVYACDSNWKENSVTYNTIPQRGKLVTSTKVDDKNCWVYIDITDYIKECRKNGDKFVSLYLEGDQSPSRNLKFNSKESGRNSPFIQYSDSGITFSTYIKYEKQNPWKVAMNDVTAWLARWEEIKKGGDPSFEQIDKDESEYSIMVDVASAGNTNGYDTKYTARPTRTISTLKGYKASTAEVAKYDQYGGLMDESMKQEATGYFYVKKIDGRWWNIDPLGYPMFRTSVVSVAMGSSATQKEYLLEKYGSTEKWAQETTDRLKELGFNSFGGWCSIKTFIDNENPLNQTQILNIASGYTTSIGTCITGTGSFTVEGNVIPSFDPDFATYSEGIIANTVAKYANSSEIYGWMSDNEPPRSQNALDNALMFDTSDARLIYSYATAWTFMYLKTGKADVSLADITDELRYEFRAMMYDKYFSVIVPLIKKYDPNHMYMGCRFHGNNFQEEYMMRVAGYWCDVITYNYYGAWDADFELVSNQVKWAGKPFVITEWYAKGMDVWEADNRMTNKSGAGWTVRDQNARGQFYQNFALSLLECKGCVGFDWFKYIDNDPEKQGSYDENSNKGIVDNYGEEYTVLTDYMKELNDQKYNLIKFFDAR